MQLASPHPIQRLGLLTCDSVREHLAARHGEYPAMFERLFKAVRPALELRSYAVYRDEFPAAVDDCDAWMITGSRRSVYEDEPWIRRLEDFVRALHAARRRTVGICFGHQLIGRALGGHTEKAAQGWGIGRHAAQVLSREPWMEPYAEAYGAFVSHQDQVTSLPPGARLLARNAHCEHSMFVLDDVFLGLQGHPEFDAGYARDLVLGREDIFGRDTVARALPTYDEPVDSPLLAQWILRFLEH
ncbi:MAG: GMP synthase [Gammaproteobacteria bacterium]